MECSWVQWGLQDPCVSVGNRGNVAEGKVMLCDSIPPVLCRVREQRAYLHVVIIFFLL